MGQGWALTRPPASLPPASGSHRRQDRLRGLWAFLGVVSGRPLPQTLPDTDTPPAHTDTQTHSHKTPRHTHSHSHPPSPATRTPAVHLLQGPGTLHHFICGAGSGPTQPFSACLSPPATRAPSRAGGRPPPCSPRESPSEPSSPAHQGPQAFSRARAARQQDRHCSRAILLLPGVRHQSPRCMSAGVAGLVWSGRGPQFQRSGNTAQHPPPLPRRLLPLPSLPVTKTKRLVTSIWHLATLTRLQGPMEVSSALLSSPLLSPALLFLPLPSHCGFQLGGGLRPQLPAQELGYVGRPSVCLPAHQELSLRGPQRKGRQEGEGWRGQLLPPCCPRPWPKTPGCLQINKTSPKGAAGVAAEDPGWRWAGGRGHMCGGDRASCLWSVRAEAGPPVKSCLGPSSLEDLGREGLIRTSLLKHCLTKHLLKCSVTSEVLKKQLDASAAQMSNLGPGHLEGAGGWGMLGPHRYPHRGFVKTRICNQTKPREPGDGARLQTQMNVGLC